MRIDPSIVVAACASLEVAVNKTLEYDPGSRNKLQALAGKTLLIRCSQPRFELYVCLEDESVAFKSHTEETVTSQIHGSAVSLIALAKAGTSSLAGSGVEVLGSTSLLSDLLAIAKQLDVDWEEPLSQLAGDVVGPKLAGILRSGHQWFEQRRHTAESLFSQYITEETHASPSAPEQQQYFDKIEQLRNDVDRVAAKFERLQAVALNRSQAEKT